MSGSLTFNSRNIIRPFVYAFIVFMIIYFCISIPYDSDRWRYIEIAFIGGLVILLESIFSVYHISTHTEKEKVIEKSRFFHHGINHTLYPLFFYIGLVIYSYFKESYLLNYSLALLSFFLFFLHFYLLPIHIIDHHYGNHKGKIHVRVDFVMYVFKFMSYFVLNLALFEMYYVGLISIESVILINFLLNSLFLVSHLNRKEEVSFMNLFITYLFAFITTIFIIKARTNIPNYSALIAVLIFYLTSGIYYHKVDGTFTYKSLVEYSSIALILSVILFAY